MRINAIYFTDKDVTHVKLNDTKSSNNYGYFHHLLINGLPVYSDTYGCDDYILKGRLESVKAVHYKEVLSHYEHKQTGEQKSEFEYREYIKSLKDENGDYKWLEFCNNEYFITNKDMSFDYKGYVYGSFDEVVKAERRIADSIESKVLTMLDGMRTAVVRRSKIAELSTELDKLRDAFKRGEQKGLINIKIDNIKSLVSDLTNNKIRL